MRFESQRLAGNTLLVERTAALRIRVEGAITRDRRSPSRARSAAEAQSPPRRAMLRAVRNAAATLVALVVLAAPGSAEAARQRAWRLASPHGALTATVRFSGSLAPLQAAVQRQGRPALSAAIGVATTTRCLPMGLRFHGATRSTVFERYRTAAGKRRNHRHLAHRLLLRFRRGHSSLAVELRVSDDGFTYRTTLTGPARRRVIGECSAYYPQPGARAWLQRFQAAYEMPYTPVALRAAPPEQIGYPALLQLPHDGS